MRVWVLRRREIAFAHSPHQTAFSSSTGQCERAHLLDRLGSRFCARASGRTSSWLRFGVCCEGGACIAKREGKGSGAQPVVCCSLTQRKQEYVSSRHAVAQEAAAFGSKDRCAQTTTLCLKGESNQLLYAYATRARRVGGLSAGPDGGCLAGQIFPGAPVVLSPVSTHGKSLRQESLLGTQEMPEVEAPQTGTQRERPLSQTQEPRNW